MTTSVVVGEMADAFEKQKALPKEGSGSYRER